jgi:hypothetical protein
METGIGSSDASPNRFGDGRAAFGLPERRLGLPRLLVLGVGAGERGVYFQCSRRQPQEQLPALGQQWPEREPTCFGPADSLPQGGDLRPEGAVINPGRVHPLAQVQFGGEEGTLEALGE